MGGGWGMGGEMLLLEDETRMAECRELKLGDGYMGIHYTILFTSSVFEISPTKKWLSTARC